MNRKQIAETLDVSEKTVSRYVASGRLPDVRVRGALDVSPEEVEALRIELQTPVETAIEPREAPQSRAGAIVSANEFNAHHVPQNAAAGSDLVAAIIAAIGAGQTETGREKPLVPVSEKMLLSIVEAAALSGASAAAIRAAVKSGELPSAKVGRGQKIRRGDLSKWADGLF